ncbi:MAG: thymidylate synthase [Nautilia sp.]|nr:MAG: thymidylate synthase [Nautilia sp.]
MKIKILDLNYKPTDIAVGSARSCYFGKNIITPEMAENWDKKNELLDSIFKAGHHTTLQHYHFTILIEGMSRHLIWRLLHSHMFYNSEQVSQRYAKMRIENFYIPKSANSERWGNYYNKMFKYYDEFCEKLEPIMETQLPKFQKHNAKKKAQEMARYLLPVGMKAHLYHTINVITALRYLNVVNFLPESQTEAKEFANQLENEMLRIDENLKPLIEFAKKEKSVFPKIDMEKYRCEKDVKIFDIINHNFEMNENYAGVLRTSNIFLDESLLGGFNSYIRLSFSADAQNQRHRRSPAIRPAIQDIYKRDFYIPPIIEENLLSEYNEAINYSYEFFEKESVNIGFGEAIYALTNAHKIEILEKDDFNEFTHKAQMRLCYNAQQEIFDIVYEQIKQLGENGVDIDNFLPPCAVRYKEKIRPYCPEGDRFCGIKVWKLNFSEYQRKI